MIFLQIADRPSISRAPILEDPSFLEHAAQEALRHAGAPESVELTLVISDDDQLRELNRQFLGSDAPTDVLSFAAEETDIDSGDRYLGDIVISYSRAEAQAAAGGHATRDELQLLVVHGVLHLLGHDHAEKAEKAKMWAMQDEILKRIGCSLSSPTE
jgi:probable rRNA maturation factor